MRAVFWFGFGVAQSFDMRARKRRSLLCIPSMDGCPWGRGYGICTAELNRRGQLEPDDAGHDETKAD